MPTETTEGTGTEGQRADNPQPPQPKPSFFVGNKHKHHIVVDEYTYHRVRRLAYENNMTMGDIVEWTVSFFLAGREEHVL